MQNGNRTRISARRLAALASSSITAFALACSSIVDSSRQTANSARITVTGTSTVPLTLVTSTSFNVAFDDEGNELIQLITAETHELSLPIDRTILFGGSDRLYVQLLNPTDQTATVDIRVTVDGREVFRQSATLRDASVRFTYYATI